jgi:hypothetical protein
VPVVEFVRFIISPERTDALVAARTEVVKEFTDRLRGFRGAWLIRVSDEEWIELTGWDTDEDADAAIVYTSKVTSYLGLVEGILGQERGTLLSGCGLGRPARL